MSGENETVDSSTCAPLVWKDRRRIWVGVNAKKPQGDCDVVRDHHTGGSHHRSREFSRRRLHSYGQQFQVLNAQAAAFHNQFVNLLTGGATAYLDTEITNARQGLTSRVSSLTPVGASAAAATTPLLGGLGPILGGGSLGPIFVGESGGILGGLSSTLGELSSVLGGGPLGPILSGAGQEIGAVVSAVIGGDKASLLSGLFVTGATASQAGSPWQALLVTTGANLHTTFNNWAAQPFPVLQQILANQKGYLNTIGTDCRTCPPRWPMRRPTSNLPFSTP